MSIIVWIFLILIVMALMVLFKFKELRHKIGLVFITLLLIFLAFSVYNVYSTHSVNLTTFDGVLDAARSVELCRVRSRPAARYCGPSPATALRGPGKPDVKSLTAGWSRPSYC